MTRRISLIALLAIGAFVGMAQTLTSTLQTTASGFIGTPATAITPFKGTLFTDATITITMVANTANRLPFVKSGYYILNDSASVSISGIGTFQATTPSCTLTAPLIDSVKGVVSVGIGFSGCKGNYPTGPVLSFDYPASSAWDMLSSFGPIQPKQMIIGFETAMLTTNGGTLKLNHSSSSVSNTFRATFSGTPSAPILNRSGVLPHIAAGAGWTTVITLLNTSSKAIPTTVNLHNDDGSPLSLPVTTTQDGASQMLATASVSATIQPHSSLLISAGDQLASSNVGWADVLSSASLGGYAIFRSSPQTGAPSEGTVPLQSDLPSTVTLRFDNAGGFLMGVAMANLSTTTANVTATVWDDSGNQLGTQNITIAGSGHTAFVLPTQIPMTAGIRGIVQFQSAALGGIAGLGLRFSPFHTFTSVPTMVSQ